MVTIGYIVCSVIELLMLSERELLRIAERGGHVAGRATEGDERAQNLAISRMALHGFLQNRHGLIPLAAGMQRDSIDIGVSRAIRLQLAGGPKSGERFVRPLQPGQ